MHFRSIQKIPVLKLELLYIWIIILYKENIKFVDDELVKIKQLIDKEKNEF